MFPNDKNYYELSVVGYDLVCPTGYADHGTYYALALVEQDIARFQVPRLLCRYSEREASALSRLKCRVVCHCIGVLGDAVSSHF